MHHICWPSTYLLCKTLAVGPCSMRQSQSTKSHSEKHWGTTLASHSTRKCLSWLGRVTQDTSDIEKTLFGVTTTWWASSATKNFDPNTVHLIHNLYLWTYVIRVSDVGQCHTATNSRAHLLANLPKWGVLRSTVETSVSQSDDEEEKSMDVQMKGPDDFALSFSKIITY